MSDAAAGTSTGHQPHQSRNGRLGDPQVDDTRSTEQYWEDLYNDRARVGSEGDRIWSGAPNELLVREVTDLEPGAALDIGCGEGGDAVWLAQQGWHVTAVDVSSTALRRAAVGAEQNGVADRVVLHRLDLAEGFPPGRFDLVSAQYFHSFVARAGERERVLQQAAAAVAPGGVLLVVGHAGWPTWSGEDHPDVHLPTTTEVLESLDRDRSRWTVEAADVVERPATGPEGQPGTRRDSVLRLRRDS